jgi:hypothetical protein
MLELVWRGREAEGKWRRKKKWWAIDEKERLLEAGVFFGRLRGRRKNEGKKLDSGRKDCWCCGWVSLLLCFFVPCLLL